MKDIYMNDGLQIGDGDTNGRPNSMEQLPRTL